MSAFDDAVSKAKQLASIAGRKTEKAVEISKLRLQGVQINSMIQSTYERIGTLIYEQEKTGTDTQELVTVCIKEIDTLLGQLNDINSRVSQLKIGVPCTTCGSTNASEAVYCSGCGARLASQKPPKQSDPQ